MGEIEDRLTETAQKVEERGNPVLAKAMRAFIQEPTSEKARAVNEMLFKKSGTVSHWSVRRHGVRVAMHANEEGWEVSAQIGESLLVFRGTGEEADEGESPHLTLLAAGDLLRAAEKSLQNWFNGAPAMPEDDSR